MPAQPRIGTWPNRQQAAARASGYDAALASMSPPAGCRRRRALAIRLSRAGRSVLARGKERPLRPLSESCR